MSTPKSREFDRSLELIQENLEVAKATLEEARSLLKRLNEMIRSQWQEDRQTPKENSRIRGDGFVTRLFRLLDQSADHEETCRNVVAGLAEGTFNCWLSLETMNFADSEHNDYEWKKEEVLTLNGRLRRHRLAIKHPIDGRPCLLLATNSYDKKGRYTLEYRDVKSRSGSYKSLLDILPFELMPDLPRKEGVIERRKKK